MGTGTRENEEESEETLDSEEVEDTRSGRGVPALDDMSATRSADPLARRAYTPVTPSRFTQGQGNGQGKRSREQETEEREEEEESSPETARQGATSSRGSSSKRPRATAQTAAEKRDALVIAIAKGRESQSEAVAKQAEEKTHHEELKNQRLLAQMQWEKENSETEERQKREDREREDRIRREEAER